MGKLHRYRTALARHHRSRGFGIHSPFAFHFVTEVLRERLPYYSYDYIRRQRHAAVKATRHHLLHPSIISNKNARQLFRVTNFFNPAFIAQFGTDHGVTAACMTAVSTSSKLFLQEIDIERYPAVKQIISSIGNEVACSPSCSATAEAYFTAVNSAAGSTAAPYALVNVIRQPQDYAAVRDFLFRVLDADGVAVIRNIHRFAPNKQLWLECKAHMRAGQTFTNEKTAFLVGQSKLPLEHFLLWF